jgi:hypothetical protein
MRHYSIREMAEKLEVSEAFVASYVFGEGLKRYRSRLHPRCHLLDDEGFAFIRSKADAYKANRKRQPTGVV